MNARYRTILYATDLTANAARAFSHALDLAQLYDAELHVLHVMPEMDASVVNYVASIVGEDRFSDLELEHEDEMKTTIRAKVDAFMRDNVADVESGLAHVKGIHVHHGTPVAEILLLADKLNADLIVLGSHGKGMINYAFLGSVAEKVLRKCHRPVMIIPLRD